MQDILIVYDSKTGNTEKVAKALAEGAGERCVLTRVEDAPAADAFAVVVAGYWVDRGAPNAKMKKYLETLHGKKVVLFQTLGAEPTSDHATSALVNAGVALNNDCKVLGTLSIRGAIDPALLEMMRRMPAGGAHSASPESEARWAAAASHPDAEDLAQAKAFMQNFLAMYDKFLKMM